MEFKTRKEQIIYKSIPLGFIGATLLFFSITQGELLLEAHPLLPLGFIILSLLFFMMAFIWATHKPATDKLTKEK